MIFQFYEKGRHDILVVREGEKTQGQVLCSIGYKCKDYMTMCVEYTLPGPHTQTLTNTL